MEDLYNFHNGHQRQFIAAQINVMALEKRDPNEVLAEKEVRLTAQSSARQKILVKDELANQRKVYEENRLLIEVIDELIKREEK